MRLQSDGLDKAAMSRVRVLPQGVFFARESLSWGDPPRFEFAFDTFGAFRTFAAATSTTYFWLVPVAAFLGPCRHVCRDSASGHSAFLCIGRFCCPEEWASDQYLAVGRSSRTCNYYSLEFPCSQVASALLARTFVGM